MDNWSTLFDKSYVLEEFRNTPTNGMYIRLLENRKKIHSELIKHLYNKNNIKQKFNEIGFKTPKTLLYTNEEINGVEFNNFVLKPAHMSNSDYVFINKFDPKINEVLNLTARRIEPVNMKNCERGILIEELIDVVYELKVFVLWGTPLFGDLRTNNDESGRVDFIGLENEYLNWGNEYELIKKLSLDIKMDFYRVDFLYDGVNLFANECAFVPSTILPHKITKLIMDKYNEGRGV
jgi:glutathione synthase/RimK-type ligase-like ATP-grasp enzyme